MKKLFSVIGFLIIYHYTFAQKNLWFDENLVNSTIKIEILERKVDNGKVKLYRSSGTGFFFSYTLDKNNKTVFPVIVTNYHVIKNAYKGFLYFKLSDSLGYPIYGKSDTIVINNFKDRWIVHPDTSVDLAILPLMPIINEYSKKTGMSKSLYFSALPEASIPSDSVKKTMNAIEEITTIGYPFGLRDYVNDLPIVRTGISATPIYLDFKLKKQFLVDVPVFFGSSGSPVFIYNSSVYTPRYGSPMTGPRVIFVGIISSTYTRNFDGTIVPKVSTNIEDSLKVQTSIPILNIGIVIKSERLLDFKKLFIFENEIR